MNSPLNIVVAMSGGVDSSVAAALLHEQGHRVIGVTLKLLEIQTGFGCCGSTRDIEDARAVCAKLGVPHYVMDFSSTFGGNVIEPFVRTYLDGETPNPCISCNRYVKFDALLKRATALGADAVATGHYARVSRESGVGSQESGNRQQDSRDGQRESGVGSQESEDRYRLLRATDRSKDQSYVLHHLGQKELARLLFPIGDLTKPEVREIARRWGLNTADKAESMEICFVPAADTAGFVKGRPEAASAVTARPGPIVDTGGKHLGTHKGVAFYTRGQREGLGLSLGRPVYVVDLRPDTNTVVVGDDEETKSPVLTMDDLHWTGGKPFATQFQADVQIRSRHAAAPAVVRVLPDGKAEAEWLAPQRAVAPGQSAVFYKGDEVIGGGVIGSVLGLGARDLAKEASR
jgi:tRNA-specific 2-thiouridylase